MRILLGTVLAVTLVAGCAANHPAPQPAKASAAAPRLTPPAVAQTKVAEYPGLHNVVAYADGIYSGSLPEGDEGFESLAGMGIRTVLSVDGAMPDVKTAEAHGLRYVHLPITYAGMTDDRRLEIARAMRDLPHPMYIHCHHGKHRSAAAVGAAAVTLGLLTPEEAEARMKVSGTAPAYTGLWQCVALATIASSAQLNSADHSFPSRWKTSGMVRSMVEVEHAADQLKAIETAGWKTPADHPDLVPAAEAGRLSDLFRELHDNPQVKAKPAEFRQWLDNASTRAGELEESIVHGAAGADLSAQYKVIVQSCKDCHVKYRD